MLLDNINSFKNSYELTSEEMDIAKKYIEEHIHEIKMDFEDGIWENKLLVQLE